MAFALPSERLAPKRFAGLFSAAPAVALAGLTVALLDKGAHDAHENAAGMIPRGIGMVAYAGAAVALLRRMRASIAAALALPVWFAVAALASLPLLLGMSSRSTEPTVRDRLEERPTLEPGKMREARPRELITRFAAGGLTSMVAGAATLALGARIGGVFLAFPAILAASLTLIEEQDICAGLKAYGLSRDALRIASAMLDIATRSRDLRLAELYCGFDRTETSEIVSYPVACRPQAWAAVAPFMLLQATLGVNASAPDATLRIIAPTLPPALARIELRDLRVGEASVDLAFTRSREATEFTLLEQRGELSVHGAAVPN